VSSGHVGEQNPLLTRSYRVDRNKYQIQIPLPPKIDASVTMMQVEEKPDVTYSDVGGCKEQIEKLREVVETPLLHVRPNDPVARRTLTVRSQSAS
jgi:ATP-dependent 26S proteasome regulatory subunit